MLILDQEAGDSELLQVSTQNVPYPAPCMDQNQGIADSKCTAGHGGISSEGDSGGIFASPRAFRPNPEVLRKTEVGETRPKGFWFT